MNELNLESVKVNDVIRYQFYMNSRNCYEFVEKITNSYIILKNGKKFKKKDGWGVASNSNYHIAGINDKEQNYEEDELDLYYY